MRFVSALLLFTMIPLAVPLHLTQMQTYASSPLNCEPSMQNEYPKNATIGQWIVITTTVTNVCVAYYNQVIVNILLPYTSRILSTGPDSPAVNKVRAPDTIGPWSLVVQVLLNYYPTDGTIGSFENTIIINIYRR